MVNRSEMQIDHIKTSLATLVISVYCVYAIRNKTHINTCDHILCAHRIPKLGLRERVRPACHIIASRPQNKRGPNRPSHRRRRRRQTLSPVVVGPVADASRWHQPSWRVGCFLIVVYLWFIITHTAYGTAHFCQLIRIFMIGFILRGKFVACTHAGQAND